MKANALSDLCFALHCIFHWLDLRFAAPELSRAAVQSLVKSYSTHACQIESHFWNAELGNFGIFFLGFFASSK